MKPCSSWKRLRVAVLLAGLVGTKVANAGPGNDTFAQIGALTSETNDQLVIPPPPQLPDKVLPNGPLDPQAVFAPADKLDTPAKLTAALEAEREHFAPFLTNLAPSLPATRRGQNLASFQWRIATADDWQKFPAVLAGAGAWQRVTIPHYGEPLGKTNTFYRTEFTLTPWATNEAVFVRFRGVDYGAHVFVNGAFIGSHEGFFAPFEFDLSQFARPGTNTLFVRVDNDFPTLGVVNNPRYPDRLGDKLYAATGPGYDDPLAGWHHCPPGMGIYQPVTIEVRPRIHVQDIFVRPLPERAEAEATVEVWNCGTTPRPVEIHFAVHGLNFPATLITNETLPHPDLAGGGVNYYRVRFPMRDFRWWSPDAPWLYDFQVAVSCPGLGTLDRAHQSFGMRSFRLDVTGEPKGRFYLNGREIRLRGANTMGAEQQCVMRGDFAQLRDDLLLAKIAHLNFLRLTQRPVQAEIYDLADRLGLMLQTDFPLFGHIRPNQFAEAVRQVGEMERLIRPHPSSVLVTYINERFSDAKSRGKLDRRMNRAETERFFAAADQAVLFQNPDQVIKAVDGDYDAPAPGLPDNHCYTLWYLRNGLDFGRLHKGFWQPVKPGWNYGCGEFGTEGLDRVELMRAHCPPGWLPTNAADAATWTPDRIPRAQTAAMHEHFFDTPHSLAGWVDASRAHQAWATRLMTEAFRRDNRMVSFAIHQFIDAWPTGWMKAIVDVERQPKPAYFAYREALTPLLPNIRTDRWQFYSGEPMRCEFWICNDTAAVPANATLAWELEVNGKVIQAQRAPADVKPVQATFQGFSAMSAPVVSERTPGKLRLALFDGAKLLHDTAIDVEFFPAPQRSPETVQLVGRGGAAERLIQQLGGSVKAGATVLLIDDFAAYEQRRSEIDRAIRQGAQAVFLDLPPGGFVLPGSSAAVTLQAANPLFLSRDTGHPLVAGFAPFDFRLWFNESAGYITPLLAAKFDGPNWRAILRTQGSLAAAERPFGKGRVILCQVLLADRVKTSPVARMFAERLLRPR